MSKFALSIFLFFSFCYGSGIDGYKRDQVILYSSYFLPNIIKSNEYREKLRLLRKKYGVDIRLYITNHYLPQKNFRQLIDKEILDNHVGDGNKFGGIVLAIQDSKHKRYNKWLVVKRLEIGQTINSAKIFSENFVDFLKKDFSKNIYKEDIYYAIDMLLKYIHLRLKQTSAGYYLSSKEFLGKIKDVNSLKKWQSNHVLAKEVVNKFVDLLNRGKYFLAAHLVDKKSYMFFTHKISNDIANKLIFQTRKCGDGRLIVNFQNSRAVIRPKESEQTCMPWLLKIDENGFWRIDYLSIDKYIRIKKNKIYLIGIKQSDYGFAYYDVKTDKTGNMLPVSNPLGLYLIHNKNFGMIVFVVKKGTVADSIGILPGDILISLQGRPINNMRDFDIVLLSIKKGSIINIKVKRGDKILNFKAVVR